jgi:hypothetical protein
MLVTYRPLCTQINYLAIVILNIITTFLHLVHKYEIFTLINWNEMNNTELMIEAVILGKWLAVGWMIRIHSWQGHWFSSLAPHPEHFWRTLSYPVGTVGSSLKGKVAEVWNSPLTSMFWDLE